MERRKMLDLAVIAVLVAMIAWSAFAPIPRTLGDAYPIPTMVWGNK